MLMIESEGITEQNGAPTSSLGSWPNSGSNKSCSRPPTQHLHLVHQELRDRRQLFVDHSQIVQLECLRAGIWGTHDTWQDARLPRVSGWRETKPE
jgi:hypothetical protein